MSTLSSEPLIGGVLPAIHKAPAVAEIVLEYGTAIIDISRKPPEQKMEYLYAEPK